ncbi:MAG: ATP-binding cassette domain-containing protein [Candidatus Bathyarchaeia archaeon]
MGGPNEAAVEVKGLVKVYEGGLRALDGVELEVGAERIFALLGPNGAGKTTLMRILTTQLRPTSGEARVFGLDVVHEGAKVRKLIGYVPQEISVWTDISGYENLLTYAEIYGVAPSEREGIVWDSLEYMGLGDAAHNLAKTYSGGMIRRLEIACAMLIRPKIMFLDEPTIGLDPSARKLVWERLSSFRRECGTTIFFNTHYMDEADLYSDEIAIINAGRIVTLGSSEELKRSVGKEVILLGLGEDSIGEEVLDRIRELEPVGYVIANGSELSVVVEDAETALPPLMEALRAEGVSIKKISMSRPTLDDVFLKYAGIRLESTGRISEVRHMRRMIRRG